MERLALATDWAFTRHAYEKMKGRGFTRQQVLRCIEDPEITWTGRQYMGDDRMVCQRGEVAVVLDLDNEVIVTVLFRRIEPWGDQAVNLIEGSQLPSPLDYLRSLRRLDS